jgi:uncharacterized protein DUF3108
MKLVALGVLALMSTLRPAASEAAEAALAPFVAEYNVRYGRMAVGTSRTELSRAALPGRWIFESRTTASGFARVIASGTLKQRSTFDFEAAAVRPQSYLFDDGTDRTSHDVTLEFDWRGGHVRGTAEDEPVEVAVIPGLQDAASMQAFVLTRLRAGSEPGVVSMIEKNKIKYYRYTYLRRETLKTAIGELETVVYRSARDGSDRETISWHAPKLGYALVQAEQRTDGKRGFQTYIRKFQPAG